MIDQLQLILKALPWTGPAVLGGFVLALLTTLLFPTRRSRADRLGFALVTWCLVVAAVVTLSPVKNDYFGVPTTGCNWEVWRPLARQYWFSAGSRPPNVWLLFPAGVGVMLLDGVWRKLLGIAFLIALPPGVETLQDLYPELKRSCSSQDVADNWTGLALGLALGLVLAILVALVRLMTRAARRRRERRDGVLNAPRDDAPSDVERDEPRADDAARLPLGGRADDRRYDDFADFDDMPNSSRWYEQDDDVRADERPAGASSALDDMGDDSFADGGATRAMPQGGGAKGAGEGSDRTPPYGTPLRSSDEAPTQVVRDTRGDDDTEIIRRS